MRISQRSLASVRQKSEIVLRSRSEVEVSFVAVANLKATASNHLFIHPILCQGAFREGLVPLAVALRSSQNGRIDI